MVQGQQLEKSNSCDFNGIVANTSGYLKASFEFSKEWDGCKKVAVFYKLDEQFAVPIINKMCEIPKEALTWDSFKVSVVGANENCRITTNKVVVEQERA